MQHYDKELLALVLLRAYQELIRQLPTHIEMLPLLALPQEQDRLPQIAQLARAELVPLLGYEAHEQYSYLNHFRRRPTKLNYRDKCW